MNRILLLILLFLSQIAFPQETVFVKGKEKGNGILIERSGECFVISPHHVVYEFMGDIMISDKNRVESTGKLIEIFEPDLAIIRIVSGGSQNCASLKVTEDFNNILSNSSSGFIEYRDAFGIANLFHVNITSKDQLSFAVKPQKENEELQKGMSGSSFYINFKGEKVLMGMLMSIEEDLKTGYIYQIDDILRSSSPFFDAGKIAKKNIGVLIQNNNKNFVKVTNGFVEELNKKNFIAYSNLPNTDFIYNEFNTIFLGKIDKAVPSEIKNTLDELILGKVTFHRSNNQYDMFVVRISLEANLYSTKDFSFVKSLDVNSKGINYDEKLAESQAIESLINNFKKNLK